MSEQKENKGSSLPPPAIERISDGTLVGWFASNPVAANILMLFLMVGGFFAVGGMITETFPSVNPRTITIATPYPGATPYDVEEGITRRVEEGMIGIEGVKRVRSSATEGAGVVTVELEYFADPDQVLKDVETEVDSLSDFPPEEAEETSIIETRLTNNMLSLAVYGAVDEHTLHYWSERIESELLLLPEVTLVNISGGRKYEISIEVSESTLRDYGLTLDDIGRRVREFSVDVPGGTLRTDAGDILIRVKGKRYTGAQFEDITVRSRSDGSSLRLGDIATIRDDFEDIPLVNEFNGKPALFVQVSRSDTQDTLLMEESIKVYLESLALPQGLSVEIWRNSTDILRDRISLMLRSAIQGYILVFICLLLFLDLKLAFWTSLGIPISFLGGLLVVSMTGISMNMITLFALIVVIGIVVDDAIVTGESIFHEQEQNPGNPQAVLQGVNLVKAPVTVGVLTTIIAFSLLLFSTGTLAQVMRPVPLVVIAILGISLIEAFYILPAHLANTTQWSRGLLAELRSKVHAGLERCIHNGVIPLLKKALNYRYVTVALCCATLIVSVGLFKGGIVRLVFFPQIDSDHITVSMTMPTGTPFDVTYRYADQILQAGEALAAEIQAERGEHELPLVEAISFTVGSMGADRSGPGASSENDNAANFVQIRMELVSGDQRDISSGEMGELWRERTPTIPGVESLVFRSNLIRVGDDIELELSHRNEKMLLIGAAKLKHALEGVEGVTEVQDSFELGKREYIFELTPAGLAAGLAPVDIGRQLRRAFYGDEIHRIQRGRNELRVMVRYPEVERRKLSDLYDMRLRLPNGADMDLRTAVVIREERGYSKIERIDGRRIVTVNANVVESVTTPGDVTALLESQILPELKREFPEIVYGFGGAGREQADDMSSLRGNLVLALMVMFVMLASLLRSYVQPLIILSAIPFGFVGSMLGHLILGFDLSFVSLFGMVALSGVVVNDSVVLVDYYNHIRQKNRAISVYDALLETVARRFRPILLTTMTTSFGLLPMLMETSLQARFLVPMAISIAFGILYASVIIIFLVPALIVIAEDFKRLLHIGRSSVIKKSRALEQR